MNNEQVTPSRTPETTSADTGRDLSNKDIDRLTNYKWRYSLESHGFSSTEAGRLLFLKWLYGHGAVVS
jgi:hypothetical protein